MTGVEAIKAFFGVPNKPVTNMELIDLRKHDKASFDELAMLCIAALASK